MTKKKEIIAPPTIKESKHESSPAAPAVAIPVTILPKQLKDGHHTNLPQGVYDVHGAHAELVGNVFVAEKNANWVPVKQCGACKVHRAKPTELRPSLDGNGVMVTVAWCGNEKTCKYGGMHYIYTHESTMVAIRNGKK